MSLVRVSMAYFCLRVRTRDSDAFFSMYGGEWVRLFDPCREGTGGFESGERMHEGTRKGT